MEYIEQGEEGFKLLIDDATQDKLLKMCNFNIDDVSIYRGEHKYKCANIDYEGFKIKVYSFVYLWVIAPSIFPDLPQFDASRTQKAYYNGFKKGVQEFEQKYGSRYNVGNDVFKAAIRRLYKDLKRVKTEIVLVTNKQSLEDYGFNCGMLYAIEQLANDYKEDFTELFAPSTNLQKSKDQPKDIVREFIIDKDYIGEYHKIYKELLPKYRTPETLKEFELRFYADAECEPLIPAGKPPKDDFTPLRQWIQKTMYQDIQKEKKIGYVKDFRKYAEKAFGVKIR